MRRTITCMLGMALLCCACDSVPYLVEPDGCNSVPDKPGIDDPHVCYQTLRCTVDGVALYDSYFCICDGNCACFFTINRDAFDGEKEAGALILMPDGFCTATTKRAVLEEIDRSIRAHIADDEGAVQQ